jgi:uncharacterized protein Usg
MIVQQNSADRTTRRFDREDVPGRPEQEWFLYPRRRSFMASLHRVSDEFVRQLQGFSLTTAEILYHLPDHPSFLQSFIWQDYDKAPEFPLLRKFLDFWDRSLDGKLHSVRLSHSGLIGPREVSIAREVSFLH